MTSRNIGAYEIREVERFDTQTYLEMLERHLYRGRPSFHLRRPEIAAEKRREGRFELRVGAFLGEALIGFTHGFQDAHDRFYVATSVVLPEHRRKGLYTELSHEVLRRTNEAGFHEVTARHLASNNPVLIAKLKLGFLIAGLEIEPAFGTLVRTTYFHDKTRREAFLFRGGTELGESLGDQVRAWYEA